MPASPEQPVNSSADYQMAMDALSPEDRESFESMEATFDRGRVESFIKGESAYQTAVGLEALRGLDKEVLEEYRLASQYLIDATVLTRLVKTETTTDTAVNPITYFKIADSLKKRATAPEDIAKTDQLVNVPDPEHKGKPVKHREYLGDLAVQYWDQGIKTLLHADPDGAELVASAVVEAAKDTENTRKYSVALANTSEYEVVAQLETKGPEQLLNKIPDRQARLEVVSLASQRINEELSPEEQSLSLAA